MLCTTAINTSNTIGTRLRYGKKLRHCHPVYNSAARRTAEVSSGVAIPGMLGLGLGLVLSGLVNIPEPYKGKGKVFPYSLPSVGPGADPGVQAVSPQVT